MNTATFSTTPNITPNDRLLFALFLSAIIHTLVIFGVGFSMSKASPKPATQGVEVTLVPHKSEKAPEKADYLAQNNQEGSGTEKEKKLLATTELLPFQSNNPNPAPVTPEREKMVSESQKKVISANKEAADKLAVTTQKQNTSAQDASKGKKSLLERSLEAASLLANLDSNQQALSKMPRVRRLTSLSTMSTSDAYYLDSWRRKIEMIGNLNYPAEARAQKIYGSLRLLVILRPNGSIEEIKLLESSGHKILDNAAVHIVKMAAPFAPFTPEMKKDIDKLEIIRTWQFLNDDSLISN